MGKLEKAASYFIYKIEHSLFFNNSPRPHPALVKKMEIDLISLPLARILEEKGIAIMSGRKRNIFLVYVKNMAENLKDDAPRNFCFELIIKKDASWGIRGTNITTKETISSLYKNKDYAHTLTYFIKAINKYSKDLHQLIYERETAGYHVINIRSSRPSC